MKQNTWHFLKLLVWGGNGKGTSIEQLKKGYPGCSRVFVGDVILPRYSRDYFINHYNGQP